MRIQHISPALCAGLTALREKRDQAQAHLDALSAEIAPPNAQVVERPGGSWVIALPDPAPKEGGDATER